MTTSTTTRVDGEWVDIRDALRRWAEAGVQKRRVRAWVLRLIERTEHQAQRITELERSKVDLQKIIEQGVESYEGRWRGRAARAEEGRRRVVEQMVPLRAALEDIVTQAASRDDAVSIALRALEGEYKPTHVVERIARASVSRTWTEPKSTWSPSTSTGEEG